MKSCILKEKHNQQLPLNIVNIAFFTQKGDNHNSLLKKANTKAISYPFHPILF